jgi:lysophospholipase L1-like esterase
MALSSRLARVIYKRPFAPSDTPNCTMWFDAAHGVYSDFGTTYAVDNDTVRRWMGHPHNANGETAISGQPTAATRPTFKKNIINGLPVIRFGGAHANIGPEFDTTYNTALTIFVVSNKSSGQLAALLSVSATRLYYARAAGENYWNTAQLSDTQLRSHGYGQTGADWAVESFRYDGTIKVATVNKFAVYQENATGNLAFNGAQLIMGNLTSGGFPYDGDCSQIIAYNRFLSQLEHDRVAEYLLVKHNILSKQGAYVLRYPPRPLLAICGGSNAQGFVPPLVSGTGWVPQLHNMLGGDGAVHLANHALQSRTAATWITQQASQLDPSLTGGVYTKKCVIVQTGTNDIEDGASAATVYTRIGDLCTNLRTAGWYVIITTLTPTSNAGFNLVRGAVNDDIRGDFSFADALVDIEDDASIGSDAAGSDTTIYFDGAHFTAEGARRFAILVREAVAAFFFQPSASIVLSNTSIAEDAAVNAVVGLLSVQNGTGSYTFTITSDPSNKFAIANGNELQIDNTLDYETATSHIVTIQADNGVDTPFTRQITITVIDVDEGAGTAGALLIPFPLITKAA